MLTEERISMFYEDLKSLGLKRPVAAIAQATGYSKGNVSQYISRKSPPSENFIEKFYAAFKGSFKKVPPETPKEPNPVDLSNSGQLSGSDLIKAIITLTESNRGLVESNKTITDTNQVIADTNRVLAMKLIKEDPTENARQDTETIFFATLGQLLDVLADIGSGKRWHSKEEAVSVLGKKLFQQADAVQKKNRIQTDGHK